MEKFALALSRFRRNKLDNCIVLCDELLKTNPSDLVNILLKKGGSTAEDTRDQKEKPNRRLGTRRSGNGRNVIGRQQTK